MPRLPRQHVRYGIYYVQLFVSGDGPQFPGPDDQRDFELLVARALGRSGAKLHAYAWLRASSNMLIQVDDMPLGQIVQSITGPYSRGVNLRLGRTGQRFEHPHGATLVQPGDDVLETVGHLHRLAIESDFYAPPHSQTLSSHSAYRGEVSIPWLTMDLVHELLAARGLTQRAGYRQFIREFRPTFINVLTTNSQGVTTRNINEAAFVRWLSERAEPARTSLQELVGAVANHLVVAPVELHSISRRRSLSCARAVITWYAMNGQIATLTEVARHFDRDPSTLSAGMSRYMRSRPELFLVSLEEFLNAAPPEVDVADAVH